MALSELKKQFGILSDKVTALFNAMLSQNWSDVEYCLTYNEYLNIEAIHLLVIHNGGDYAIEVLDGENGGKILMCGNSMSDEFFPPAVFKIRTMIRWNQGDSSGDLIIPDVRVIAYFIGAGGGTEKHYAAIIPLPPESKGFKISKI